MVTVLCFMTHTSIFTGLTPLARSCISLLLSLSIIAMSLIANCCSTGTAATTCQDSAYLLDF